MLASRVGRAKDSLSPDDMSPADYKFAELSIELDDINQSLKKEFGFVRHLKKLANKNETDHDEELIAMRNRCKTRIVSPNRESIIRKKSLKKISSNNPRFGSSMGHKQMSMT